MYIWMNTNKDHNISLGWFWFSEKAGAQTLDSHQQTNKQIYYDNIYFE